MNRQNLRKILNFIIYVIAVTAAFCSILSLFRNTEIRYPKMLAFPRIQFFIVSLISIIAFLIFTRKWKWHNYLLSIALLSGMFIQGAFLINYTPIVPLEIPWAIGLNGSYDQLSILLSIVKMTNRKTQPLIELIEQKKPDLILAMETDEWWDEQLKFLENQYPYSQHTINEVTYGMVRYSKFPLQNVQVDYLNNENVPSFQTTLSLTSGSNITFHSIHPVPRTHFQNLPDIAGHQETALQKLGKEIMGRKFPTIVAGDLNDVV